MRQIAQLVCLGLLVHALPGLAVDNLAVESLAVARPISRPSSLPAMPAGTGLAPGAASMPNLPMPTGSLTTLPTLPMPPQLPGILPPLAALPDVPSDRLPAVSPASAICQFKTPEASLNFGAIPAAGEARAFAQPLLLQVECSQSADFRFSTSDPALPTGSPAERSSLLVTLRGRNGSLNGSAWVRLEQDGQPLATRRFSVPAASPTLIAANAVLVASPTSDRTPASSGSLDSLVLARQLYLIDGSAP